MANTPMRRRAWLTAGVSAAVLLVGAPAWSQDDDVSTQLKALRAEVEAQARQLEAQRKALEAQDRRLREQALQIQSANAAAPEASEALETIHGRGGLPVAPGAPVPVQTAQAAPAAASADAPPQPVGEAPPPQPMNAAAAAVTPALPEFLGVLTKPGHWVLEPQLEFTHASTNELIFRGVQIVPGVQIGLLDANTANRNTFSAAWDVRTGITKRLELELRVPYVWRHDQTTTLNQQGTTETITETVANSDIGDIEVIGRYQLNSNRDNAPIWIAGLDVKSDTGLGPYDVPYDKFGVAQKEATGSGFWSIQPTVSVLYPSDPVVLFASVGYIESLPRDVNRVISGVTVSRVNPGGSPTASVGFAFALNDRFSFSLGYKHSYIRPTETHLNAVWTTSLPLQVGVSTFGLSYRLTPTMTFGENFEFGMTRDAPDVHMLARLSVYY